MFSTAFDLLLFCFLGDDDVVAFVAFYEFFCTIAVCLLLIEWRARCAFSFPMMFFHDHTGWIVSGISVRIQTINQYIAIITPDRLMG